MCCRAAHPIAQDAQGRWGVVGWDPGCCSSAAAVELTGFRTWTPTPSFVSSKGTKSAMLILRGSRRFWARPSFHGTMEWGTGAKLTRPRRCRANLMPSFDVEFLHLVGAWRQFAFAGLSRELPVRRSSRTNEENLARLRAFLCPRLCCPARSPPASLFFPGILSNWLQATAAQGRLAGSQALEGLPAETWQLGVMDWWSTSTDRIGQPFCHRPTTVHLIKREGRTKTGQCNIPLSTARLFLRKVDKAYHTIETSCKCVAPDIACPGLGSPPRHHLHTSPPLQQKSRDSKQSMSELPTTTAQPKQV